MLDCVGDDVRKSNVPLLHFIRISFLAGSRYEVPRQSLSAVLSLTGQEGKGGDVLWARGIVPTPLIAFHVEIETQGFASSRDEVKRT
jgi:hypothetical protein